MDAFIAQKNGPTGLRRSRHFQSLGLPIFRPQMCQVSENALCRQFHPCSWPGWFFKWLSSNLNCSMHHSNMHRQDLHPGNIHFNRRQVRVCSSDDLVFSLQLIVLSIAIPNLCWPLCCCVTRRTVKRAMRDPCRTQSENLLQLQHA